MKTWGQPVKGKSRSSSADISRDGSGFDGLSEVTSVTRELDLASAADLVQAQKVASHTEQLLTGRGWCLWECHNLGDEMIIVVRDELVENAPGGYPIYTKAELEELCRGNASKETMRLVHEAKKSAGARIITGREQVPQSELGDDRNTTSLALGMSIEQALNVWTNEGRPAIHLGPGENCFGLEKLLSHSDINPRHLSVVRDWLSQHSDAGGDPL